MTIAYNYSHNQHLSMINGGYDLSSYGITKMGL